MQKWLYSLLLLTLLTGSNIAYAAEKDITPYDKNKLVLAQCAAKGNFEFIEFLKAMSFSDGIYNGTIEPFNDFLFRNQCQGIDVSNLMKQRDKVRSYIRDAFLTCNTQKLPQLVSAFHKFSAEIYYVRNIVDGKVIVSLPADILTTRLLENDASLYTPSYKVKGDMKARYVEKELLKANEFDVFFEKLETKYSDRKKSYVKCKSSSWEEVEKKWNEFVKNSAGIKPAFDKSKKAIGGRSEKLVEALTNMSFESYLKGLINVNINKLGDKKGVNQILTDLDKKYSPSNKVVTQSDLLSELASSERSYDLLTMRETLKSTFEVLYKVTGDGATEGFVEELRRVDKALNDSQKPLSQLKKCSDTINSKQCPSN